MSVNFCVSCGRLDRRGEGVDHRCRACQRARDEARTLCEVCGDVPGGCARCVYEPSEADMNAMAEGRA